MILIFLTIGRKAVNKMQDLPLCDLNEVKRTAKRTDSDISVGWGLYLVRDKKKGE